MHARTMENTNRRRNAPTEAAAKPRTRYISFTADHGRDLGDVLAANMANTANMLHDLLNDQHRQRPRRSDPRPAARSAPATAPPGQRDQRRGLSFYWLMNDAQRAKLDTDKQKGHHREIYRKRPNKDSPTRGIIINLLLFMCLFLLTFLDINISMPYNMHKRF